jgi:hypothetical protein
MHEKELNTGLALAMHNRPRRSRHYDAETRH